MSTALEQRSALRWRVRVVRAGAVAEEISVSAPGSNVGGRRRRRSPFDDRFTERQTRVIRRADARMRRTRTHERRLRRGLRRPAPAPESLATHAAAAVHHAAVPPSDRVMTRNVRKTLA